MPEALRAVIQYGFDVLQLHRIEALVMLGNEQSVRVLEKLGFSKEGVLREYGFWKNRFWDLQMFATNLTNKNLDSWYLCNLWMEQRNGASET